MHGMLMVVAGGCTALAMLAGVAIGAMGSFYVIGAVLVSIFQ